LLTILIGLLLGTACSEPEAPEAEEVVAIEANPVAKRISVEERRRSHEAQQEFAKGFRLLFGVKGEQDRARGHEHLLKAAELGHVRSQSIVGVNYQTGRGVARDPEEGLRWIRLAAEGGYPHAQFKLGEAYRDGAGVEKDPVEALKWMALGGRGGSIAASMIAGSYAQSLEPIQRQEAMERARAWRVERGLPVRDEGEGGPGLRAVVEPVPLVPQPAPVVIPRPEAAPAEPTAPDPAAGA
jgi:TPR repeat protein